MMHTLLKRSRTLMCHVVCGGAHTEVSGISSTGLNICSSCFPHQEVLLKRAADLVEALYGMPHNNQVGVDTAALLTKKKYKHLLIE